jgi:DnaJ-class molecular chaperone
LSPSEQPIKVKIRKGEVKKDGHIITIKGRGWRKGNNADNSDECGDLHVKVHFKGD